MELLEALIADVDHVAGFIPGEFDILRKGLRNGKVLFFVLSGEERRGQVVIASIDHDAEAGIGLERIRQIVGHVEADGIAAVHKIPTRATE